MASLRYGFACWRGVIASMALAGIVATPTVAADLGGNDRGSYKDDAPYYAPPFNWTGGYAGLQFGYAWGDTDAISGPLTGFDQSYGYDTDGLVGGGHLGYNIQSGTLVYGIETDIEYADIGGSGVGSLGTLTHNTEVNWLGSVRGRFGFAMDRTLLYATGGLAFGDVDINKGFVGGGNFASYGGTRYGWTLGAGLEQAFSSSMTMRLEYRYTDLGSDDFRSIAANSIDDSDVTLHTVRAGVSVKF